MIDIYTDKKESKDWILQNDLYFNLNTGNEEMSQNEINLIQQVDEARLTPDKHIETKYGLGTIRNLSSGCKTLLNIVKHPDKVVNVEECGPNVLEIIFTLRAIYPCGRTAAAASPRGRRGHSGGTAFRRQGHSARCTREIGRAHV